MGNPFSQLSSHLQLNTQKQDLSHLNYLQNASELEKSPYAIQQSIRILLPHLEEDKIPYSIDEYGFLLTIQLPNGENRLIYNADYGFDSSTLRRLFEDKIYTSKLLRKSGFLVAEDMLVARENTSYSNNTNNTSACLQFAQKNGYPLIFKPNDGSLGKGVTKIFNKDQLINTLAKYNEKGNGMYLLQKYISGKDYRAIYLDGDILVAYERIPPTITGNGQTNIKNLIQTHFQNLNPLKVERYLASQGISTKIILAPDESLPLLPTANIATGGSIQQITTTDRDRKFLSKIAQVFGARYFGVDIISEGELTDGYILEINKSPITKGICEHSPAFETFFSQKIRATIKKDEHL